MNDTFSMPVSTGKEPLRPLRDLYFEVGRALSDSKQARFADAVTAFKQALNEEDSPRPAWEIYLHLAVAYERTNENGQALHAYLEAVARASQQAEMILPHAHTLLTRSTIAGENEWLQSELVPALDQVDLTPMQRASAALFLGRANLYLAEYQKALTYFQQAQEITPKDTRVIEGLGQALWRLGKLDQAETVLRQANKLATEGNYPERLVAISSKLTQVLAASGKYDAALAQFEAAFPLLEQKQDEVYNSYYHYELLLTVARCRLALGDSVAAIQALDEASKVDSTANKSTGNGLVAYLLRAQALIALKRYSEAVGAADEALQYEPSNSDAQFYKIQALIEGLIDVDQARRQLKRYSKRMDSNKVLDQAHSAITTAHEDDEHAHYFLAQVNYVLKNYQEAWQELDLTIKLAQKNLSSTFSTAIEQLKAELFEAEGRLEEAAEIFYEVGNELYKQNNYLDAIERFEHTIELKTDHTLAYLFLAASLGSQASTTTPPSKELLQQALDTWDKSYAIGLPSSNLAWAYAVRAFCLQKMTELSPGNTENLWWETVYYLERAVILDSSQTYFRSLLQVSYDYLHKDATARQISEQNPDAFGRALMLYYLDDEHAIDAIDRYQEELDHSGQVDDPNTRLDIQKAILLYRRGNYDDAIKLVHRAQKSFPNIASLHYFLGRLYRLAGEADEALAKFEWVWNATSPGRELATDESLVARGDTAYELGYYEESIKIYQDLLESREKDSFSTRNSLAYSYLALGQIDKARELFIEAEKYLYHAIDARIALTELAEAESRLGEAPENAAAQELIKEYSAVLESKIKEFQTKIFDLQDAVAELREVVEDKRITVGTFAWLAAQAGLARLDIDAKLWQLAITRYETLLEYNTQHKPQCFPEAPVGLALTLALRGFEVAQLGEQETALEYLRRSLKVRIEAGQYDAAQEMVQDCSRLISKHKQYSTFSQCLRLLADDPSFDDKQHRNLIVARLKFSREQYRFIIHPAEWSTTSGESPAAWKDGFGWTVPSKGEGILSIELGLDLIIIGDYTSVEESVQADLIDTCLPAMRDHIRKSMGVIVPGIDVRDNLNITPANYRLLLSGTVIATGTVLPKEKYCPNAQSCRSLGILGQSLINPVDGKEGMWLQRPDWEKVRHSDLPLWSPYQYIVFHLETLLHTHLANLLGIEEVQVTVEEWMNAENEDRQKLVKLALPNDFAVVRLTHVLRGLAEEQVTIRNLESILITFTKWQTSEVIEIIEHVRAALRPELPGKQATQTLIRFPSSFEEAVAHRVWQREGKHFLAIPSEEAQELLNAVRESLAGRDIKNLTLIVRKPGLRPFVRRLIVRDFPSLIVLAEDEAVETKVLNCEQIEFTSQPRVIDC